METGRKAQSLKTPWEERVMRKRHAAAGSLRKLFGILWIPLLYAIGFSMPGYRWLMDQIYFRNWLRWIQTDSSGPANPWGAPIYLLTCAICFVAIAVPSFWLVRWLTGLAAKGMVRLYARRLDISDITPVIDDPLKRMGDTVPKPWQIDTLARSKINVLTVIDELVDRLLKSYRGPVTGPAVKNSVLDRQYERLVSYLPILPPLVVAAAFILPNIPGLPPVISVTAVIGVLATPFMAYVFFVLKHTALIAVCDHLLDNEQSEFYRGWSVRVKPGK